MRLPAAAQFRCEPRAPAVQLIALRDPVVEELGRLGFGRIRSVSDATPAWRSGGGGGVPLLRYDTQEGPVLCKQDAAAPDESAFAAESASLKALRAASMSTGGLMLRVPRPLGVGALPLGGSFLLLEWVEGEAPAGPTALGRLGAGLAALHTAPQPPGTHGHGFRADTWLGGGGGGGLRQDNRWGRYLSEFFVERRLRPQLAAAAAGDGGFNLGAALEVRAQFGAILRRNSCGNSLTPPSRPLQDRLLRGADALLRPANGAPPALLHGALSAATVSEDDAGRPVLRDAACWYGPPEADLACDLAVDDARGRLGAEFHDAYHSAWAFKEQAGAAARRDVYVLYHRLARHAAQRGDDAVGGVDAERTREIAERVATEGLLFEGRAGGGRGFM